MVFFIRIIVAFIVNSFILKVAFDRQVLIRAKAIQAIHDQNYVERLQKTTGQFSTMVMAYCSHYTSTLISSLRVAAELIAIIFITCLLVVTNINLFFLSLIFTGTIVGSSAYFFSNMFIRYGEIKNQGLKKFADAVQDSVNGLKEIKILKISDHFKKKVVEGAKQAAIAEQKLYLYSIVPRYFIEFLLVIIVTSSLVYSVFISGDIASTISSLSIFLVAAVRLLPSLNSVFSNFNTINIEMDAVAQLFNEIKDIDSLNKNSLDPKTSSDIDDFINFKKLTLDKVSFSYQKNNVINELNLEINKGDFIGLLGKSGEGKTTLVDLILGIHIPNSGEVKVDGISIYENIERWRENLAYLPQEAFLINASIIENIAIGETVNSKKLEMIDYAIKRAGLSEVIDSLPDGKETVIGERGLTLSGGQRQRLALARAFYKNKKLFIFDESTSALDKESASRILNEINKLSREGATVILISHNDHVLEMCTRRIELKNGKIIDEN